MRSGSTGRSFQPLYSTGFQSSTRFRYDIDQPGEYVLLLDNRLEGRGPTPVKVRIELWNPGAVQARTVPKERQRIVIGLSLLFFAAVVAFSARQFLK